MGLTMIDFEKLKEAHELCEKYSKEVKVAHRIAVLYYAYEKPPNYSLHSFCEMPHEQFDCLDALLEKLHELTRPKPKYEVGQKVFVFFKLSDEIEQYIISNTEYDEKIKSYIYELEGVSINLKCTEEYVYPSREALIEAQIQYWTKLQIDAISSSKICQKCGMQRLKDGVCWATNCGHKDQNEDNLEMVPKFEGEVKGFNDKCEHEPEMNFGKDCRPRHLKSVYPLCVKCREVYSHES